MSTWHRRPFVRLQLLGWGGFYLAMAFSRVGSYPLSFMLVSMAALTALGVLASTILGALLRRLHAAHASLGRMLVTTVVGGYLLAAAWTVSFSAAMLLYEPRAWFGVSPPISWPRLFDGTVYHAFALIGWGFLYLGIRRHLALQETRERLLRAEAAATEARLAALEARLRPHFLFNTLNGISTLITEGHLVEATSMLSQLGTLLRSAFRAPAGHLAPLRDDLALVDAYLAIEATRLGDRLRVTREVDPALEDTLVPHLLLQPLVENAILHGVAAHADGGDITITIRRDGDTVDIAVANHPLMQGTTEGSRVGLSGVADRLSVLYPGAHSLTVDADPDSGFVVRIRLPLDRGRSAPPQAPATHN